MYSGNASYGRLNKLIILCSTSTNSVKVNGVVYKTQAVLATKPPNDFEDTTFGQIKEIYVVNSAVYFYLQVLDTLDYSQHYSAYITKTTLTFHMVELQSVASYLPLSPYSLTAYSSCLCLIPKFIIR